MSDFLFISPNERGIPRSIAVVSQSVQSGVPGYHNVTELHHNAATRSAIDQALAQADFVFLEHSHFRRHLNYAVAAISLSIVWSELCSNSHGAAFPILLCGRLRL